jgi:hypothetical protein
MTCPNYETVKLIVSGVVLAITAIGGFGVLAIVAWRISS